MKDKYLAFVLYRGDWPVGVYESLEDCCERIYGKPWSDCTCSQRQYVRNRASYSAHYQASRKSKNVSWLIYPQRVVC